MENKDLQDIVNSSTVKEKPINLDYAKQENKRNWKRLAVYGCIAAGLVGSYYLTRYVMNNVPSLDGIGSLVPL